MGDGKFLPNWKAKAGCGERPGWLSLLHRAVHQASVEHERRILNRHVAGLGLSLDPQFAQLSAMSAVPELKPVSKRLTFSQLVQRYSADRAKQRMLSPKSELKQAAQFDLFQRIIGAKTPLDAIDRDRARAVQDALMRLPANAGKKFPGKSVKQLLELPPDPKHPPMAALTINTYMTAFAALMRYAEREGLITKSPAEGLRVADGVSNKDRRDPIQLADMRKIFTAPLFRTSRAQRSRSAPVEPWFRSWLSSLECG